MWQTAAIIILTVQICVRCTAAPNPLTLTQAQTHSERLFIWATSSPLLVRRAQFFLGRSGYFQLLWGGNSQRHLLSVSISLPRHVFCVILSEFCIPCQQWRRMVLGCGWCEVTGVAAAPAGELLLLPRYTNTHVHLLQAVVQFNRIKGSCLFIMRQSVWEICKYRVMFLCL